MIKIYLKKNLFLYLIYDYLQNKTLMQKKGSKVPVKTEVKPVTTNKTVEKKAEPPK